jgi:hypothetical protein
VPAPFLLTDHDGNKSHEHSEDYAALALGLLAAA